MTIQRIALLIGLAVVLGGCSGNKELRSFNAGKTGPDEFMILPVKPLAAPADYAALPEPTPGGVNLVDPTPKNDAVAALGGRASSADGQGIPSSDAALVRQASRNGVQPDIRADLAQSDEEFRKRRGRFTSLKLTAVDRYDDVYKKEAIDPFTETERFRRAGIPTPTAPPPVPPKR